MSIVSQQSGSVPPTPARLSTARDGYAGCARHTPHSIQCITRLIAGPPAFYDFAARQRKRGSSHSGV
jgi:hypothetical protein